jgi:hypothetical protein
VIVLVRDHNGNTLGRMELADVNVLVCPPEAKLNDYGDVVILTLVPDDQQHQAWEEEDLNVGPDPRDAVEPHSVLDHPEYGEGD